MMIKQSINTSSAPAAIGPYSQAIKVEKFLFISGQLPIDPDTGELVTSDIEAQTHRVMQNVKAIVEASGGSLESIVKVTIFIKDMTQFSQMNQVYAAYFPGERPARSCVEVARLPRDVGVEIEAVAYLD
ncbi:MAG: RidA family protein [Bacillota bacterium]